MCHASFLHFLSLFLSDPSPIIGYACHSLTHWLTHSLLFSKLDWCNPGLWRSLLKLLEVVTGADVSDEDRVGNSLLQIWKLRFGHKAKLLFRPWAQHLIKILKLKFRQDLKLEFGQYFDPDVWLRLRRWIWVKILNLGLTNNLSLCLVEKLMFGWDFEVNA